MTVVVILASDRILLLSVSSFQLPAAAPSWLLVLIMPLRSRLGRSWNCARERHSSDSRLGPGPAPARGDGRRLTAAAQDLDMMLPNEAPNSVGKVHTSPGAQGQLCYCISLEYCPGGLPSELVASDDGSASGRRCDRQKSIASTTSSPRSSSYAKIIYTEC